MRTINIDGLEIQGFDYFHSFPVDELRPVIDRIKKQVTEESFRSNQRQGLFVGLSYENILTKFIDDETHYALERVGFRYDGTCFEGVTQKIYDNMRARVIHSFMAREKNPPTNWPLSHVSVSL